MKHLIKTELEGSLKTVGYGCLSLLWALNLIIFVNVIVQIYSDFTVDHKPKNQVLKKAKNSLCFLHEKDSEEAYSTKQTLL